MSRFYSTTPEAFDKMPDLEALAYYLEMKKLKAQENIVFISNVQACFDPEYSKKYVAQLINIAYQDNEKAWSAAHLQLQRSSTKKSPDIKPISIPRVH